MSDPEAPYPRWVGSRLDVANLREVGPGLYVGSAYAPERTVANRRWALVVDLCGSWPAERERYEGASRVVSAPFQDGQPVPTGYLDRIALEIEKARRQGPILIHCAAGFSRSPSVAYAMLRRLYGVEGPEALRRARMPGQDRYPLPMTLASAHNWAEP